MAARFVYVIALLAAFVYFTNALPLVDEDVVIVPLAEEYRLPKTISPIHYNIALTPYLLDSDGEKRFTFEGDVEIEIQPTSQTSEIVMHSKNLKYTKREYWQKGNEANKQNLSNVAPDPVTDKITYKTDSLNTNFVYVLHFVYTGSMDEDMKGFYRSFYTVKNVTKWLGATQFQTHHARRVFPSFDEPRFKATFTVSIQHHESMKAVSNTPSISTIRKGEYLNDLFATTPKMSTYLLAFIVSDFNERSDGRFAIVARPDYYPQTEYSFEIGQEILDVLNDYLDISYYEMGVAKMHMAAIPDFSAGAMENWGLLTYRERALLYQEGATTLQGKQSIATIIAHEQAHMWFGDLVTCEWWSYAWLNEGFARYFQYFATGKVETEMEMEKQFTVDQIQSVMVMDSTKNTNPMSDPNTHSPADLSRMFNSITYNKGASVIRMVKHIMGEGNFQKSLREYLNKNKYDYTVPQNLFTYWNAYWPKEYEQYADTLFKSFTEQVGYPLITVIVSSDRKSAEISQKRFLLNATDGSDPKLLYTVPITYTTDKEMNFTSTKPKLFLNSNTPKYTENFTNNVSWIIGNIQQTGYYRVNYDTKTWHNIHAALIKSNWSSILEVNRAQIVDDLFNLARASEIDYDLALQILEYLQTETHYIPWTAAFNGYSYLHTRLGTETENFGVYIRQLTEKVYRELGFEERKSDKPLDIYNRAKVLAWSCKFGNKDCINNAKEYFSKLRTNPVPVNIRSAVYCTAMREGNKDDFEMLFNKYKNETVATEQTLILSALGCVKAPELVTEYFWNIVKDVRRQDQSSALSSLYGENNENVFPVFKLVTDNCDELAKSMGSYSAVASVISGIASRFTNKTQEKELKDFNSKNKNNFGDSQAVLEEAEITVEGNLLWADKKLGVFKQYLFVRANGSAINTSFSLGFLVMILILGRIFQ